jgi:hypothetical protein
MRQRALRDDFAAEFARAGAEVEDGVGTLHRLVIVLDDEEAVSFVAQGGRAC